MLFHLSTVFCEKSRGGGAVQIRDIVGFEPPFSANTALKMRVIRQDCPHFVLCLDEKLLAQNCKARDFCARQGRERGNPCRIPSFDNAVSHEKIRSGGYKSLIRTAFRDRYYNSFRRDCFRLRRPRSILTRRRRRGKFCRSSYT